jgi:hypothetical protein
MTGGDAEASSPGGDATSPTEEKVATAPGGGDHEPAADPAGPTGVGARRLLGFIPRTSGRRISRPVYVHLMVLAGYLVAGVLVNWDRALYLVQGKVPYGRDMGLLTWDFWWMAHSVTHLANPYYSHYQAAPVGVPLAYHTLMPLPGALMTPLTLAFGAAFPLNLLTVLAPGLTCYTMYRVARLWLPTQTGAIAAGALFGLCTIMTWNDWYWTQLMLGQILIPVVLEAAIRMGRRPGWRQAVILGLVIGVLVLTDQESTALAVFVVVPALLPWLARLPSRGGDPWLVKLRAVVLAGAVSLLIGSPQLAAMYTQQKAGDVTMRPDALSGDYHNSGAALLQMFAPSPRVGFFGLKALQHYYFNIGPARVTMVSYGWVVTVVALFGLVVCWRRRGTRPLALLWLFATLLALGTAFQVNTTHRYVPFAFMWDGIRVSAIMPYTWLVHLSVFASFREANRITELGMVPAALLAGAGVDWLRRKIAPAAVVVLALAVLEMGAVGVAAQPTMPVGLPALDRPIAADHSNSIVVDVPVGIRSAVPFAGEGAAFNPEVQMLAAADGHPRTIAYVSRMSRSYLVRIQQHPFYRYLLDLQQRYTRGFTEALFGRHGQGSPELTAARQDAHRMDVGWAIIWSPENGYLRYLKAVGFRFAYRADGISVYRLPSARG